MEDILGSNFRVSDKFGDVLIEIIQNGQFVPFARATILNPGDPIVVEEEKIITEATGLTRLDYRSWYRKIATEIESLGLGRVRRVTYYM